jgi:glycerol-3-phosphate dehydrogenase
MLPGGESLSEQYHGAYKKVYNETGDDEISYEHPDLFENVYTGKDFDAEKHLKGNMQAIWQRYGWLPQGLVIRYASSYGSLSDKILEDCESLADMGEDFGASLYAREVEYLVRHEYARTAEDVLWRRTKLGLVIDPKVKERLQQYIDKLL